MFKLRCIGKRIVHKKVPANWFSVDFPETLREPIQALFWIFKFSKESELLIKHEICDTNNHPGLVHADTFDQHLCRNSVGNSILHLPFPLFLILALVFVPMFLRGLSTKTKIRNVVIFDVLRNFFQFPEKHLKIRTVKKLRTGKL